MDCAFIQIIMRHLACEMIFIGHAQFLAQFLQFTVSAPHTGKAFLVVV